jgi:hypothetical protein
MGVVGVGLLVGAPRAQAGYTAVKQPKRAAGASHEQILEHVYGGDFVADAAGLSFSNQSGVTVTRLQDDGAAADNAGLGGRTFDARAVAAFAGKPKTARYFGAGVGRDAGQAVAVSGRAFDVSGTGPVMGGDLNLTARRGHAQRTISSVASANRDGMDHLVTYEVKGASGQQAPVYLLCWEDKFARRSDRDFNDVVIELQAAEAAARAPLTQPLLIPLPPAAWPGLGGLLGGGIVWRLRLRKTARRWAA